MKSINDKQQHHFLSPDVQNELIILMLKTISDEVKRRVKEAKYFSILVDYTRDCSRVEHMSDILRYCNTSTSPLEENFIASLGLNETIGNI